MMKLTNQGFEKLIQQHLPTYKASEPNSARVIIKALPKWRKSRESWLDWWKAQSFHLRIELRNFLFWLVQNDLSSITVFSAISNELIPMLSRVETIPVSMVESDGTPKFKGGIVIQEWTVCNYKFTPFGERELGRWSISFESKIDGKKPSADLDLVLSAISFDLHRRQRIAKLGFVAHHQQTFTQSVTEITEGGFGPTVHILPSIEPGKIEQLVMKAQISFGSGLSVGELMRVRHRAILENNLESKLITLWSAIEFEFGNVEQSDSLLTDEQRSKIDAFLREIQIEDRVRSKVIDRISGLRKKTKNDKIKDALRQLRCSVGHDISKDVSRIFNTRGRFAHGGVMEENKRLEVLQDVTFLFAIVDEIIETKLNISS